MSYNQKLGGNGRATKNINQQIHIIMNTIENEVRESARNESGAAARSQRVSAVAWLAGLTAFVALGVLSQGATIGILLGVIGVCATVAVISWLILRAR